MKNYYQILGIKRNANNGEIKSAYRKLALKFHPDKNNGDKYFEERFKEIQEAYEILSDQYKKEKFDYEYDLFFNINTNFSNSQTKNENINEEFRKEKKERKYKENLEKEGVNIIKKNEELAFEDKAWIFIGNWFIIPGLVGLIMFIKYKVEGFSKKANTVCSLTIISFIVFLILVIILTVASNV